MPPVEELSVSVEVPVPPDDKTTLPGLSVAVRPDGGVAFRETGPLNPPRLTRLMVEVDVEFEMNVTAEGAAVRL